MSRVVSLINSTSDKNRIFVTGNEPWSTKLSCSKVAMEKVANQIENTKMLNIPYVRRCHILNKNERF